MSYRPNLRDRIAVRLANAALWLATPYYRHFIAGAIRYGMDSAARDAREGKPLPPPWDADLQRSE